MVNVVGQGNQVPPKDKQVLPLEEVVMGDQVPFAHPPMEDGDIRECFLQMAQAIKTHAQAMTTQDNREVVPRENQNVSTIASHLRDDYTRMNPLLFIGQKLRKNPKSSLIKSTRFYIPWG